MAKEEAIQVQGKVTQALANTQFRVRLDNLKPGTVYYYTAGSMDANGTDDGMKSTVKQLTTPGEPQRAGR